MHKRILDARIVPHRERGGEGEGERERGEREREHAWSILLK